MKLRHALILTVALPGLFSGCVMTSRAVKEYRWHAGGTSVERSSDSVQFELTYHGRKEETAESAIDHWHEEARRQCRNRIYDTTSIGLKDYIIPKAYGAFVDDLYVYYPVVDGWPQVVARVEC